MPRAARATSPSWTSWRKPLPKRPARARKLRAAGDLQLACHLVDFVRKGEPSNREAWELWRDLFSARAQSERSLMARGAYLSAVREAEARLKDMGA